MPIETDADRRVFLEDDGVAVVWQATGGTVTTIGLYDDDFIALVGDAGFEQAGSQPMVTMLASDKPATGKNGDAITVGGTAYEVIDIRPDGQGMIKVKLGETD